jgi:hypothetical protein
MVGAGGPDSSGGTNHSAAQLVPRKRPGTTIPPESLRRALIDSMTKGPADTHTGPSATPGARGVRGRKKGARGREGVRGRGRRSVTAASPSSPPPPVDSPKHRRRSVDSLQVDAPILDRPVESEGTPSQAWPEALLVDGEPTATGWGEDAGEDDQGDEAEGGEGVAGAEGSSSSTVYQRGATRLPDLPATREQRTLVTPHGEK